MTVTIPSLGKSWDDRALLARVLGRPERHYPLDRPAALIAGMRILVTGARGSIGQAVVPMLRDMGATVLATDIPDAPPDGDLGAVDWECYLDVCNPGMVADTVSGFNPDVILHLAGAKHAPEGELNPIGVINVNTLGTANVVASGRRVVLASTGKAADPETAYGASKLIAERHVLNHGGSVARFYNVVETSGNVFEIWDAIPDDGPLPVARAQRFFITIGEACALVAWTIALDPGRYIVTGGQQWMAQVAQAFRPGRPTVEASLRRGDRYIEPRHAASEFMQSTDVAGIYQVLSRHDAQ